jgi:methylthioribose-1-phosphate isomerase
MKQVVRKHSGADVEYLKKILLHESLVILDEDKKICRRMAKFGASLVRKGDTILTHCNAGGLATADYGTALGVIYRTDEQKKGIRVYACETRPLLQGARLTAWELKNSGIDVTLICDNMAAGLMKKGKIDMVIVGADRIATNGDTANKIGTYGLAVLANFHRIPFYVVAPTSTFDLNSKSGDDIRIEERGPEEITHLSGRRIAPANVKVYNPAFDVTPGRLITAIITENGIFKQPYHFTPGVLGKGR